MPSHLNCSFGSILQGDQSGVEIATDSHVNFLTANGCLRQHGRIISTKAPRDDKLFEGVVIDDYFAISIEDEDTPAFRSRSAQQHSRALAAYSDANILGSPDKGIIGEDFGKIIGAQIDSRSSTRKRNLTLLSSPSKKRIALSWVSLQVAALAQTTDVLHLCLIGGWTSSILFRRPFMSVLARSYNLVDANNIEASSPKMINLPRDVCTELVLLAVMAPIISSNLAAGFLGTIFATDASCEKGAIVQAEVKPELAKVLHRCLRSKGSYTRVRDAASYLLEEVRDEAHPVIRPEKPIAFVFDFLEIYAGSAKISRFMAEKHGWSIGPPIDLSFSPEFDMKEHHVIQWISFMIAEGRLGSFAVEPPCTTYSIMRRPALRDKNHPYGFNPADPQTADGNFLGQRAFQVIDLGGKTETPGILETPHSSKLKNMPSWKALERKNYVKTCRTDSCRFGSPHRKSFCFLTVHLDTAQLEKRCQCEGLHVRIQGQYTKASATYTDALAEAISDVLSAAILALRSKDSFLNEIEAYGLENQIVNSVMRSAPWRLRKCWTFPRQVHINILELKVVQVLCLHLGFEISGKRIVVLVDSNVVKCAVSKGRSASRALTSVLVKLDTIMVACDLYLTAAFCPTRLNVSDDPTRDH